jgi:hypothetical protein
VGKGLVYHIPDGPWLPEQVEVRPGVTLPVYPLPDQDIFGKSFAGWMKKLNRSPLLLTDAPWHVRVRAWRPKKSRAITLHWVNYHQVEDAAIETPVPTGPIRVNTRIPSGWRVERVEWRYPEMSAPATLPHTEKNGRVFFTIPGVIVYGLSVIYLMKR